MSRPQISTITIFSLILALLYFGFDTKPSSQKLVEKSRALKMSSTDISILRKEAFEALNSAEKSRIELLNAQLDATQDSVNTISLLKELSGAWYELGYSSMAGYYAEKVAEYEDNDDAWGIAATTYALGIGKAKSDKERNYSKEQAMKAFEVAISMNPNQVRHQVNRAVTLADYPDQDNPMKGIQLMLSLNRENPDNVSIINQLAKFGMKTNQMDKAKGRLEKALELEPNNTFSNCLMSELLVKMGDNQQASAYAERCNRLRNSN